MGKSIEIEAKTTKEAIQIALKKLGVTKDKVKVEILKEECKGLFGMEGAEQAKVKVTVRDK